jgi:ribosomal protein S18 acetylase RimI-like enzyme
MSPGAFVPIGSAPRSDLARLFDEEGAMWVRDLRWSFTPTRHRLEAALDEGTLRGLVASDAEGACAYATYAIDGGNGIVGSVFASARARGKGMEETLVQRILNRLHSLQPSVIDCQTLFSSEPSLRAPFAERGFESAGRIFMVLERAEWLRTRAEAPSPRASTPTKRVHLASLARLVYDAHLETHRLDASSSFDSLESCERILRQIVLDEVCGPFDADGSRRIEENGGLVAACLLTWPLPGVAHVSEVATARLQRRKGLARQCLAESLERAFGVGGASSATLSVTASNDAALALYGSMGFVPLVRYESHVWRESGS